MYDVRDEMRAMVYEARKLHMNEKVMQLRSCQLIHQLEEYNTAVNFGLTKEEFAREVGLSVEVYWKRAQIGRVLQRYPEVEDMIKKGELQLSHVNIFAGKITSANADSLLDMVKNKTSREVQFAVSTITPDGRVIEKEPEIELRLVLKKSVITKLERAIDILSSRGKIPSQGDVVAEALEALLEKKDPARKLARSKRKHQIKKHKKEELSTPPRKEHKSEERSKELSQKLSPKPNTFSYSPSRDQERKRHTIPALIKAQVYSRDQGRCTYIARSGERCQEERMLEFDHIKMWCRSGEDTIDNLRLRCRYHNQNSARYELGRNQIYSG